MTRTSQTWRCGNCGHSKIKTVKYPKYGASDRPITDLARCARCSQCRKRGWCVIREGGRFFCADGRILDADPYASAGASTVAKVPLQG